MIKIIGDNYKFYGLIIIKTTKKSLVLDYGFSNATFETTCHVFALEANKPNLNLVIQQLNKKDIKFQHQTQIYFPELSKKKRIIHFCATTECACSSLLNNYLQSWHHPHVIQP
jgi:hypothetical protein